ncbi:SPOR domain-containing protein [Arsenicibacter rosenii]|uniref:Sporulation protein n=1 Tax=Arsenicibacter rosenii TaxID=1750698 RepID=A0A1S2VG90_9BACT|nr:SPOR domain-containing protein [Arsenicibacter rosenii]OIN57771.1 sporulation protein [Arsenicibacter rosenii]
MSDVRPAYTPAPAKTEPKLGTGAPESKKIIPSMSAEAQHVNRRLEEVMDASAAKNKSIRYAPGYRIQVYTGNERQSAEAAKLLVYQNFPELNPYLSYKQPTYKLKVGDFMRKMDAERYYSQIKSLFPTAVLQPDKIDIRYSMSIN